MPWWSCSLSPVSLVFPCNPLVPFHTWCFFHILVSLLSSFSPLVKHNLTISSTFQEVHSTFKPDLRAVEWLLSFTPVTALIPKQPASNHQFRRRMKPIYRMPSSSSLFNLITTLPTSCLSTWLLSAISLLHQLFERACWPHCSLYFRVHPPE